MDSNYCNASVQDERRELHSYRAWLHHYMRGSKMADPMEIIIVLRCFAHDSLSPPNQKCITHSWHSTRPNDNCLSTTFMHFYARFTFTLSLCARGPQKSINLFYVAFDCRLCFCFTSSSASLWHFGLFIEWNFTKYVNWPRLGELTWKLVNLICAGFALHR